MLLSTPCNCIERRILKGGVQGSGRLFVQVGAGVGNLDSRTIDGFSEFMGRQRLVDGDLIVVVEPNPMNVALLEQGWSGSRNIDVQPLAVIPSGSAAHVLILWFAREDGPNFQVTSHNRQHVLDHYPNGTIESFEVEAVPIDLLLRSVRGDRELELLAVDVESLDAEILMSIDWQEFDFNAVSFESFHMGEMEEEVRSMLMRSGYVPAGMDSMQTVLIHCF